MLSYYCQCFGANRVWAHLNFWMWKTALVLTEEIVLGLPRVQQLYLYIYIYTHIKIEEWSPYGIIV